MACRWVCLFTSSHWLMPMLVHFYTHTIHVKFTQTQCQWGMWKSELFRWGPVQKHIMFSWKSSDREGACLLSHHLTSVGRRELLSVVVSPLAEHADLWKQTLQSQTEAITLSELIEQDLAEQLCFELLYLHLHTFPLCGAHQWELMRLESHSQRRVKDPEPGIIFISFMVDYMACCFLTATFTVYQADMLLGRTSCASSLLPLEITGTDNDTLCTICSCLCSLSTSAGHTVNHVSSSTPWKLRRWLGLTFTYPNTAQGWCFFPATLLATMAQNSSLYFKQLYSVVCIIQQ